MNKIDIKVIAGKYYKTMTLIDDGSENIIVKFPFSWELIAEVKAMEGARAVFDDNTKKFKHWTIKKSVRNAFVLDYLQGNNPYEKYEKPLVEFTPKRKVYEHQHYDIRCVLTRKQMFLAAEMGCIFGGAIIHINIGGAAEKITLTHFYNQWLKDWKFRNDIKVKSYDGHYFRLNRALDVIFKGYKECIKLTTEYGKEIILTPDHEVAIENGYKEARLFQIGDSIITNGKWMDEDGYIRVGGLKGKHPRWTTGGVYEHILIMEKMIGRYVEVWERVHHKNEIKHDNRPDNLELLASNSEHAELHGHKNYKNFGNGTLLANLEKIITIEKVGLQPVYDIVCESPHHNFVVNNILVHNCGKSLVCIEAMEESGFLSEQWIWVAPRSGLRAVELELLKWQSKIWPQLVTYNGLKKLIEHWPKEKPAPRGIIFDECHEIKNPMAQRSQAAKYIADNMRKEYGEDCFIIEMSGTPAPKDVSNWWFPCEIVCPGFIKESNIHKFKQRLGIIIQKESPAGGVYPELVSWYDDEKKCKICGKMEDHLDHSLLYMTEPGYHKYEKSINEVANFYERAKGLVVVHFKKDILKELPEKNYRIIRCTPTQETLRAAKLILKVAPRAITAAILLRELSDGFQYQDIKSGTKICRGCLGKGVDKHPVFECFKCNDCEYESQDQYISCPECQSGNVENIYRNTETECLICNGNGKEDIITTDTVQIDCPKVEVFEDILEEHQEVGRLVTYCGFTGSVDKIVPIAIKQGWDVLRADGRGFIYFRADGLSTNYKDIKMLQYFQDKKREIEKLAFIGQSDSAGTGLTLTESPSVFYYSNSFNGKSRFQSEDRCHRIGMDLNKGCTIIDVIHLPSDQLVLDNLKKKRNLQNLSMGELNECIK